MVWPIKGYLGVTHPLLHAGQHDVARRAEPARRAMTVRKLLSATARQVYFLSRSSSSIEMPCGPRMKQMRTPGRMVVGSLGELDALGLDLGSDRVDVLYRQPEMVEPLIGRHGRRVDAVACGHRVR